MALRENGKEVLSLVNVSSFVYLISIECFVQAPLGHIYSQVIDLITIKLYSNLNLSPTPNIAIVCEALPSIQNGEIIYAMDVDGIAPYNLGATATYSCDKGFHLLGNPVRACDANNGTMGTWNGIEPICECKWHTQLAPGVLNNT